MGTDNGITNGALHDALVTGRTTSGPEIHAQLLRLTRYAATLEIYGPEPVLRISEAFDNLKIVGGQGRTIYSGPAVILNLVDGGLMSVCEVKLNEDSWIDLHFGPGDFQDGQLRTEFQRFLQEWQRLYKISPEFKLVITEMQSFLSDLKLWLDQVELNIRSSPTGKRADFERQVLQNLSGAVLPSLATLFERFEAVATSVDKDLEPVHAVYAKRQIHPVVLCAPFMYRTYRKPLGYAGDYEMVNMMARDSFQGGSVFAKVINTFFLNTPPVAAHRNRIVYLTEMLTREVQRVAANGRSAKVLNLGCGPALEIQAFLEASPVSSNADFTLLDFNDETVGHATRTLEDVKQRFDRRTTFRVLKKSVAQLFKEQSKPVPTLGNGKYDVIYCAGLFDYLADPVCSRLIDVFYRMLSPGGIVVTTNVDVSNPSRGWMEYMVDWHLFYRNSKDMLGIMEKTAPADAIRIFAETSGVNIFAEIRKPADE